MKNIQRLALVIAAGSVIAIAGVSAMREGLRPVSNFYGAHRTGANRAAGGVALITALWLANRLLNGKIQRMQKSMNDQYQSRWEQLDTLQARFENTPWENFRQVADEKISQMTKTLDVHTAQKLALLDIEFRRIILERERVERELRKSQDLLTQVDLFLQTVKDEQGDAFLRKLVQTKQEIESSLIRLQRTKNQHEQELAGLATRLSEQVREVERTEGRTARLQQDMRQLERFVEEKDHLAREVKSAELRANELAKESERVHSALQKSTDVRGRFERLERETTSLEKKAAQLNEQLTAMVAGKAVACPPPAEDNQSMWGLATGTRTEQGASPAPSAPSW